MPAGDFLRQFDSSLRTLTARVSPAVVQIVVTGYGAVEDRHGETRAAVITRQRSIGSGVILDPSGFIITNAHVVEGAQKIRVYLALPASDSPLMLTPIGKRPVYEGTLVGVHKETDLALIKVDAHDLPTLRFVDPANVVQGELVIAMGSPEGLENSVSMGVVSSVARQPDPDKPMVYVQTDAPINPGNSGGPLVDVDGNLVGINTFILSESGGSEGLGFAIPGRVVKFVYESLRKHGHVHRGEIGASAQTVTPTLAQGLGLSRNWGVIISDVVPKGSADAAVVRVQDIVLALDNRRADTLPAFERAMYLHRTDEVLKMDVLRGEERKTFYVPVVEEEHDVDRLADLADPEANLIPRLGVVGVEITSKMQDVLPELRKPSGVVIAAKTAGISSNGTSLLVGDVVHTVNRTPIATIAELRKAMDGLKPGYAVVIQVERQGKLQYVAFEME